MAVAGARLFVSVAQEKLRLKNRIENQLNQIPEPITLLIGRVRDGDPDARERLWKIFLPILKQKSDADLRGNNVAGVLNPSDLVQDAAMVLLRHESIGWNDRVHLYAFAATVIRHIIIDRARKHVIGNRLRLPLDDLHDQAIPTDPSLLEIDDILNQLARIDPAKARVFEMRFFGGMTNEEIAGATRLSQTTVKRYIAFARAFILSRLDISDAEPSSHSPRV